LSKLPSISGATAVRAFERVGYTVDRQRGSHIILRQIDLPHRRLVVPNHSSVAKGAIRALIREAGLTVPEFLALL